MQIVDTNVLVYLLLEGDHSAAVRRLHSLDADWHTESFMFIEFSNVLTTAVRTSRLSLAQASELLNSIAEVVSDNYHSVPHSDALAIAAQYSVSAYDARFLSLALSVESRLVTEDRKLRTAAPLLTQSVAEALAAPASDGAT